MTNFRFVSCMVFVAIVFGLLNGLWIAAANAAELQPGRCVTTEELVTNKKTGEQHITRKTVCEYTKEEQRKIAAR